MIWSKSLGSITSHCSGNEAPDREGSGNRALRRGQRSTFIMAGIAIYACTMFVLIRDTIRKVERRHFLANETVKNLENNHQDCGYNTYLCRQRQSNRSFPSFQNSLSKRGQVQNLFCVNEFYLHENENSLSYQWLRTQPRFETCLRLGPTRKWTIGNSNQSLINKSKSGQKLPSSKDAVKPTTVVVTKVRVLNHRYDKL